MGILTCGPEEIITSDVALNAADRPEPGRIAQSILWQGGGAFIGQVLSWIATIIVIRLLAPTDYGLMAMATIPVGLLVLLCDLGVGTAVVQAATVDLAQLRKLAGVTIAAGVGAAVLLIAGAPVIAAFFAEPRLTVVLRWLSLAFLLNASYAMPQALLIRELNFRAKAAVEVAATAASALVALALALLGWGVWALVGGALAIHIVKAVAFNAIRPVVLRPIVALSDLSQLLHIGALVTADRVLQFLLANADMAVTGRMLGPERLGIYSIAVNVSTMPLEKVLPPTVQVSFAALSRMQAEPERLRRNVLRGVRLVSLLLCPAFLGLAAVAPDLVPLLLGAKWQAAVVPIQLLCLVLPLRGIAALFQPALFAIGRPGLNAANTAVTLVIMAAAFLIGVRHGVTGVAIAWVAAYPIAFAIVSTSATRALGLTVSQLLKAAAPPTLASIVMALGVVGLRSLLADQLAPAVGLGVLIVAGAAAYAAILWILDRDAVTELWRTLHG